MMSLERADKIAQELWDQDVRAWEAHWVPIFGRFARDLVKMAGIVDGHLVLDVGTGTGVAAIEAARVARQHGFVIGIDQSARILSIARAKCAKRGPQNLRFLLMDERGMEFPGNLFDQVISNCGIPLLGFDETANGLFSVLRRGGTLSYNNWHLREVPAHRIFGEVLQRHRTRKPSNKLQNQRMALSTLERYGNWDMTWEAQIRELKGAGFTETKVRRKLYQISLGSVDDFLKMRFDRETLRQELKELTRAERAELYNDMRVSLKQFVHGKRFMFDWEITFVRTSKP
jgi:ubiquinone/menaquinone biosynthesis C-methylase UbiE